MDAERARPAVAPTGDARVDQAVEGLADLDQIDLDERPAVLEEVHDRLREILGELGPVRPAPGARRARRPGEHALGEPAAKQHGRPGEPGRPGQQGELGAPRPRYAG